MGITWYIQLGRLQTFIAVPGRKLPYDIVGARGAAVLSAGTENFNAENRQTAYMAALIEDKSRICELT